MAAARGYTISRGTLKPCKACAIGKAKQKNVVQVSSNHNKANKSTNERRFLDIATIKNLVLEHGEKLELSK